VNHLKLVITRLNQQLQRYQHLEPLEALPEKALDSDVVLKTMSGHMMAPLFKEYEAALASQNTEITSLRYELQKSLDQHRALAEENESLLQELTLKTREHFKLINDYKDMP
jgi:hypothetical protein